MKRQFHFLFFLCLLLGFAACTKSSEPKNTVVPAKSVQDLVEKGKLIFELNCVSCHGAEPTKDGPVGPALAGSSLPLIEARVLRAAYPEGYKPKRSTALMVALPHLKNDLAALHAYLNSFTPLAPVSAKAEELCQVSGTSDCNKSSK